MVDGEWLMEGGEGRGYRIQNLPAVLRTALQAGPESRIQKGNGDTPHPNPLPQGAREKTKK